ncbi:hypothetical protein [Pedobacter sp. NJ-S-72]
MIAKKDCLLNNPSPFGYLSQDNQYVEVFEDFMLSEVRSGGLENVPFKSRFYSIVLCMGGQCMKIIGQHMFRVPVYSIHVVKPNQNQVVFEVSPDFRCFVITFAIILS